VSAEFLVTLTCRCCGAAFEVDPSFYEAHSLHQPRRCRDCRAARKAERVPASGYVCGVPHRSAAHRGRSDRHAWIKVDGGGPDAFWPERALWARVGVHVAFNLAPPGPGQRSPVAFDVAPEG
jgi:hypothetical protein